MKTTTIWNAIEILFRDLDPKHTSHPHPRSQRQLYYFMKKIRPKILQDDEERSQLKNKIKELEDEIYDLNQSLYHT